MDVSTRTTEGDPTDCPVCGKQTIVSICSPLGDATCPHCGSLIFPRLRRKPLGGDAEERLAALGVLVETNDQGEIAVAEFHGPRFNDSTIAVFADFIEIPVIKLHNTGFTPQGIVKLREALPKSSIEEG